MKKKKIYVNKYVVILAIIALIISIIVPVSYAFFTATVTGNNTANSSIIESGTMRLTLSDGAVIGTTSDWIPGTYLTKTFSVTNTGSLQASYSIVLEDVINTFVDKSDLVYEIVGTTSGTSAAYSTTSQVQVPGSDAKIIDKQAINSGDIHTYTLTLTFLNKNEPQDDNQGKTFSGKIQLKDDSNNSNPTLIDKIVELKNAGTSDLRYDGTETLGSTSGTSDNNIRYIGTSPSNYVYYNCSTTDPDSMSDSTCEKWRIIGLFNNMYTSTSDYSNHSNFTSLVKIVKNDSLGDYSWDFSALMNGGTNTNQWGVSGSYQGADIMRELNTDYLGNITVGTTGNWYKTGYAPMPSTLLNSDAVDMIQEAIWYLGGFDDFNNNNVKAAYNYERSNNVIASPSDNVERTTTWLGKVALLYPSDMYYATSGGSVLETCLSYPVGAWQADAYVDCKNNDWVYSLLTPTNNPAYYLTPSALSDKKVNMSAKSAIISSESSHAPLMIFPSLYLKSEVKCLNCDSQNVGTSSNPYKLSM